MYFQRLPFRLGKKLRLPEGSTIYAINATGMASFLSLCP
jgi:hypothetical protein